MLVKYKFEKTAFLEHLVSYQKNHPNLHITYGIYILCNTDKITITKTIAINRPPRNANLKSGRFHPFSWCAFLNISSYST